MSMIILFYIIIKIFYLIKEIINFLNIKKDE
jgi:hypothetical protein